jgi:hypothetical protein
MAHKPVRDALAGRGFLLLPVAALAVHELRYRLAYGSDAGAALAAQGHGYLDSLAPWLILLLGLVLGRFLVRVARVLGGRPVRHPRRTFVGLWALASLGLVLVYSTQELLESVFASGHPDGLSGLFGHGGWWSLAAAVAVGAALAAAVRTAGTVLTAAGRLTIGRRPLRVAPLPLPRSAVLAPATRAVLAGAAAGRAPPGR